MMVSTHHRAAPTRRGFLIKSTRLALGAGFASVLLVRPSRATPDAMREAIHGLLGEAVPRRGKITLDIPPLVENGNTVPLTIAVESPMIEADYVKAIHLFNEKNPQPYVLTAHLSPRNGRATLATRIKLADTQQVVAIAEMSDGSFWSESADVIVTIAACVEDIN